MKTMEDSKLEIIEIRHSRYELMNCVSPLTLPAPSCDLYNLLVALP